MSIDLIQNFIVEVDSVKLLKQYLELALPTVLNSTEEIAVKVIDHDDDQYKSLYYPSVIYRKENILPVLLIEGWYKSKDKERDSFFNGYKPWKLFNENTLNKSVNYAMGVLSDNQSNLLDRFSKGCGDGYQLISNKRFPNSLTLSLVHIYYGK